MQPNWKRGTTRLCLAIWAVWLLILFIRVASLPPILWVANIGYIVAWGLVVPGAIFLAVRWVVSGFVSSSGGSSSTQA